MNPFGIPISPQVCLGSPVSLLPRSKPLGTGITGRYHSVRSVLQKPVTNAWKLGGSWTVVFVMVAELCSYMTFSARTFFELFFKPAMLRTKLLDEINKFGMPPEIEKEQVIWSDLKFAPNFSVSVETCSTVKASRGIALMVSMVMTSPDCKTFGRNATGPLFVCAGSTLHEWRGAPINGWK